MKKYILAAWIFTISANAIAQKDTAKTNATMNDATIYYGYGAELTHKAKVNITKNTKFIVIDKLSTQIDLNSLQISCPENISLLSQQFTIFTPTPKAIPESIATKKIKDSIKIISKEIGNIQNKILIEEEVMKRTDKLIESTIATSGSKTALTAEVLKLIDFNNAKIEKNRANIFNYQQKIGDLNEKINELTIRQEAISEQNGITNKETEKPYGRIIMQVVCRNEQSTEVSLSYYTQNAGWQPIYDIRVNSKTNALKLVYKASVIQNTGIDWTKTKLTLSTGTPNFTTAAPILNPWYLQLYAPQLYGKLDAVVVRGMNSIQSFKDEEVVEVMGIKRQSKELGYATTTIAPSTLEKFTNLKQGMLNTSFEIDLPYDIASNGQAHSINIKEGDIQSNLKNYAVPKLDADGYLLAEITNWQNLDLIPGNANIIMDDTYIGKSFIDPNVTADTLNLSLGKDKRVSIKRTLMKDASLNKIKEATVKQTFTYELVVKNNKIKDINIVLKDQYPLTNIKEVETILTDDGGATVNTELGILTWKINLKPGESKKVRFTYTVKYPKDRQVMNLK